MKNVAIAAVLCLAATAFTASAQQVKPENQIKLRKAAYALMNYNFGSLAAMAEDKKPYNKDEAARNADMVAMLSDVPKGFFGEGSDKGETRAKPAIWQKRADFDAKMDKMIAASKQLPQAARTDLPALRKAVGDAADACQACHDDYRAER